MNPQISDVDGEWLQKFDACVMWLDSNAQLSCVFKVWNYCSEQCYRSPLNISHDFVRNVENGKLKEADWEHHQWYGIHTDRKNK
jgi:hypothetical protein